MKDELEKYNDYIADIKKIDRDIAILQREEVTKIETNKDVIDNTNKIKILELQKNEKQAQLNYIDSLLNTLKYNERVLLKMYYIEKKEMSIIQSVYKREADSIHKSIAIYINKLDKKYEKQ